jgi:D-amino-acid dehydrogenase
VRVVVIGAGLQGVATAWFLAREGCEVTVLERAAAPAQGTSHANAGMLTPSMADPWNAPGILRHLLGWLGREDAPFLLRARALPSLAGWGLAFLAHARPERFRASLERNLRLATYSLEVLGELRTALDLQYDQRTAGTIKVFRDARALDAAAARLELLARAGLAVRALTPQQAVQVEPALGPVRERLAGAFHCPQDESGDARAFTEALARRAAEAGARFHFGRAVTALQSDGDRIVAAATAEGPVAGDLFVLAAGPWSAPLLAPLGARLPVRPVKGYSITVPIGAWEGAPRMPVVDDALHAAATPLGDRLRVAGTAELAGDDLSLPPARIENLHALLLELFPSYAPHLDRARAEPWAGLRPVCADGVPLIGRYRWSNLFLNTGHGHLGWTLAAGSARLLADLVLGLAPAIDAAPYRAERPL